MSNETHPSGTFPSMPGQPEREPTLQGTPPPSVANAVKIMLARAALSLLGLVVLIGTKDTLKAQILLGQPDLSPTTLDTAVSVAITVGVVVSVIFTALYVLLALQVQKGKNWARIVTLVLAGLSLLFGLAGLAQPAPGLSRILGLVTLVLDAAIIALLVLRPSAEYFRRRD